MRKEADFCSNRCQDLIGFKKIYHSFFLPQSPQTNPCPMQVACPQAKQLPKMFPLDKSTKLKWISFPRLLPKLDKSKEFNNQRMEVLIRKCFKSYHFLSLKTIPKQADHT